jgi:hypothetical protein
MKYSLLLPDFNETLIFSADFAKNSHVSNFMKIRPVGAELSHAVRRTGRHDEANSRFRNFSHTCEIWGYLSGFAE